MKPDNVCRHLRTKKLYIAALADEVFAPARENVERCGHCWCNRTLNEVGLDNQLAGIEECNPSRPCFEE